MSELELWNKVWKEQAFLKLERTVSSIEKEDIILEALSKVIEESNAKSVIELGCGSGPRTLLLAKKYDLSVTLVDFSSQALILAKHLTTQLKIKTNMVRMIRQDVFKLSSHLKRKHFDVVWSGGLNEHFAGKRRQEIFNIMSSLCRPKGRAVVIVPNKVSIPYWFNRIYLQIKGKWEVGYENPFTPLELTYRMKRANLKHVRIKCLDWSIYKMVNENFQGNFHKFVQVSFQGTLLYGEGMA